MKAVVVGVAVIFGLLALLVLATMRGTFLSVPPDRDPALVGRWDGYWGKTTESAHYVIEFEKDGTGRILQRGRFRWGTKGDKIVLNAHEVDNWAKYDATYRVTDGGGKVAFSAKHTVALPTFMTRSQK